MADTGKKVEVRYGAFSCVIEGYDDPVAELRDVLGLMQRMITETPAMAQIATDFDADRVQDVLKDEAEAGAEGSPGVVVIRTGDATKTDQPPEVDADTIDDALPVDEAEDHLDHSLAELADHEQEEIAEPIVGRTRDAVDAEPAEELEPAAPSDEKDAGFASRLGALAAGAAAAAGASLLRKSPDDASADATEERAGTAPVDDDPDDPYEEPREAFTDWLTRAKQDSAEADDEAAADVAEAADELVSGLTAMHAASDALTEDAEPAISEASNAIGDTLAEPAEFGEAALDTAVRSTEEDLGEAEIAVSHQPEADSNAFNIFADPDTDDNTTLSTEPEPETPTALAMTHDAAPVEPQRTEPGAFDAEPVQPVDARRIEDERPAERETAFQDTSEPTPGQAPTVLETLQEPTDVAGAEAEPAAAVTVDEGPYSPAPEPPTEPPAFNMFADPDAEPSPAPFSDPAPAPTPDPIPEAEAHLAPIDAVAEPEPTAPQPIPNTQEPETVAVPAEASEHPISALSTAEGTPGDEAIEVSADPVHSLSANPAVEPDQSQDFAAPQTPASGVAYAMPGLAGDSGVFADSQSPALEDENVNIFAGPEANTDQMSPPEPEPTAPSYQAMQAPFIDQAAPAASPEPSIEASEPETPEPLPTGQGFNALLNRIHGSTLMGAPGEPSDGDEVADMPSAEGLSAADMAERSGASAVVDLLASSAAWLTLAQKKPRFTRREVMEVFDTLPGDHPRTLEARIKGFGKLVRSGTLILIDDGVFAMAQSAREKYQASLT